MEDHSPILAYCAPYAPVSFTVSVVLLLIPAHTQFKRTFRGF